MAAEDNLSHELFFEAHRGLRLRSGNNFTVDRSNLGTHWSADEGVARDFAGLNFQPDSGQVYHARVPMSSVNTDTESLKDAQVINHRGTPYNEEEVPVKPGAKVLVTGRTTYKEAYGNDPRGKKGLAVVPLRTRTRTYNPPREMNA
jgi:hypothetical protein